MDWINLKLESTGGTTRVPDEPGVRERYEAHGWVEYTPEPEKPFHPAHSPEGEPAPEFVELGNAETGARHLFPNNPEAIAGAAEQGWVLIQTADPAAEIVISPKTPEPAPVPKPKTAKADSPKEKV